MELREPLVVISALPVPEDAMARGLFPIAFTCYIGERLLTFEIAYNDFGHFFTMRILDNENRVLVCGALMYGVDFCKPFQHIPELRGLRIVPFDMTLKHTVITPENFGTAVKLYYYDRAEYEQFAS